MRPRTELAGAFLAVLSMLCVGCVDGLRPGNATLRDYTGLDGCGWVIEADEGAVLEPLNLGEFISDPTQACASGLSTRKNQAISAFAWWAPW